MAVTHTIRTKDGFQEVVLTRGKAIREFCKGCCCWNTAEVRHCPRPTACALWPYRMGTEEPGVPLVEVLAARAS